MFWNMEGNVASSSWLPVQKFAELQNSAVWPLSPGNFWKDSCNSEHVFTQAWEQRGTYFESDFTSSVSSMPAWEAHTHTQNAWVMPGGVQDQLQELYCHCTTSGWCMLCTHTSESLDMDYLKGPSQLRCLNSQSCTWISCSFSSSCRCAWQKWTQK